MIDAYDYSDIYAGAELAYYNPNEEARQNANATEGRQLAVVAAVTPNTLGSWNVVGQSGSIAIHFLAFTNGQALIMQRPDFANPNPYLQNADGSHEIAAFFDMNAYTFTPFHIAESPFCSGHALLPNGNGLVVGGDNVDLSDPFLVNGFPVIRIIDPFGQAYTRGPDMPTGRWYPTLVTLPDGTIMIASGSQVETIGYGASCSVPDPSISNPTYIIYNPTANTLTPDIQFPPLANAWPLALFPFLAVLPFTGSVMVIVGNTASAWTVTATGATADIAWGTPAQLPIPISYPQTATITLLPMSATNNWAPRALVIGGSSADCANPGTPASAYSYLIDISTGGNHAPVQETMPAPRMMGDAVILPDGTIFVSNGGAVGTAGGGPGYGACGNPTTAAHLYDPTQAVGNRWRVLADSLIPRLYHSISILTQNGDVMVTGSEATADYRVQIWTPSYLLSGLPRPVIASASPLIIPGSRFPIQWSGIDTIDRVVISKMPGVTHSTHMDQRQLVLACTAVNSGATAGTTTCQAPPDFTVAPPGQYILFIMRNGVPSVGQYVQVTMGPPPVPAGTYVLQNVGKTCARATMSVAAACAATFIDTWVGNDGSGRQTFTLGLPNAGSNSYTITTPQTGRPGCNTLFVGSQACGAGNAPLLQATDDGSGKQRWSIVPVPGAVGQYYIVGQGRPFGGCGSFLGAPNCASGNYPLVLTTGDDATGLQAWTLTSTAANAASAVAIPPPLPSGTYTIANVARTANGPNCRPLASVSAACQNYVIDAWVQQDGSGRQIFNVELIPTGYNSYTITVTGGRAGCVNSFWSMQACGGTNVPDLYARDDGSGRQRWSLVPVAGVPGQYNIIANGRPGTCGSYLGLPACNPNNNGIQFVTGDDGSGLQRWTLTSQAPIATVATQPIPDGTYQMVVAGGRQNCEQYLYGDVCGSANTGPMFQQTGGPNSIWGLAIVPGTANQYTIVSTNRGGCNVYLSGMPCAANNNSMIFAPADDGTGAQRWTLTAATNNPGVYDVTNVARAACYSYLSSPGCGQTWTDLYNQDDSSGRQQWRFTHA